MLEEKHLQFVEVFLRCRGSIKEVEKALGVSYPTVRNMMDAALVALGFEEKSQPKQSKKDLQREEILERLSRKEISVDVSIELLNKLKGNE